LQEHDLINVVSNDKLYNFSVEEWTQSGGNQH
jgi:hypothetical protein